MSGVYSCVPSRRPGLEPIFLVVTPGLFKLHAPAFNWCRELWSRGCTPIDHGSIDVGELVLTYTFCQAFCPGTYELTLRLCLVNVQVLRRINSSIKYGFSDIT